MGMTIDVGAGTVDFGMFASGLRGDHIGVHSIGNAKYSLPVGGNDIDEALVKYVLDKAKLRGRRRAEVKATIQERRARALRTLAVVTCALQCLGQEEVATTLYCRERSISK